MQNGFLEMIKLGNKPVPVTEVECKSDDNHSSGNVDNVEMEENHDLT
jgi:hypothetical protein